MSGLSQPNKSTSNKILPENVLVSVTNDIVRFLVNKSLTKAPIKRADIIKFLNTVHDGSHRNITEILVAANKKLTEVYGYKLVEVNSKSQYILVLSEEDHSPNTDEKNAKVHILLITTLAHIFMNGGSVKEDAMWRFLEKAGLMEENDTATKKILTHQFTKELYLSYVKTGELDNPKYHFKWGTRAEEEMPKSFLLSKIGEAFNRTPDYWYEQHKEATQDTSSST